MVDAAGGKPLTKSDCAEELGALGIHGCDGCCTKTTNAATCHNIISDWGE
jgi:hypothetical protein